MNADNNELDPQLGRQLSQLREAVPPRNEAAARQGRTAFMQAAFLAQARVARNSVRPNILAGLGGWGMDRAINAQRRLAAAFVSLLLVTGLVSGTAFAAQGSLPNQALYPVKLFIEDARLAFANDAHSRAALQLGYAERRLQELAQVGADEEAARIANTRLQQLMQAALQNAAQLGDDATLKETLTQADDLVSRQEVALKQNTSPAAGALQVKLATQQALIATGLADPQGFREAVRGTRPVVVAPSITPAAPTLTQTPTATPTAQPQPTPVQTTPEAKATQPAPTATRRVIQTPQPRPTASPKPTTPNVVRATVAAALTALPTRQPTPDLKATKVALATAFPRPTLPPTPDLRATRAALLTALPRPTNVVLPTQLPTQPQRPTPDLRATKVALATAFPRPTPLPAPPTPDLRATREVIKTALPKLPTPQPPPTQPPELPTPQPTSPAANPTEVPPSPPTPVPTQPPPSLPTREPRPTRRFLPTNPPPPSTDVPPPPTPQPPPADTPAPTEAPISVPVDASPTPASQ